MSATFVRQPSEFDFPDRVRSSLSNIRVVFQKAMIYYVSGNLFESPAQALVNTVNTVGVMGKGLALQFKQYYPEMFREYQSLCEQGKMKIGVLYIYRTPRKIIINFPTKENWRKPSKLEYIEKGLKSFVASYQQQGIHSIAFPPLGCGNGELDWNDVRPLMERFLAKLPIPVYLYAPMSRVGAAEHRTPADVRAWLHSEPKAMPFSEVWNDLRELLATPLKVKSFGKQAPLEAVFLSDGEEFISVRAANYEAVFGKAELRMLWQELRAHGIAVAMTLGGRDAALLYPFMAQLPYLRAVPLADSYAGLNTTPRWALQIAPRPEDAPVQRSMAL